MVPIFVASTAPHSGKAFVTLGLALNLQERGYKVGFIKPLGNLPIVRDKKVFDEDALFIRHVLGLTDPLEVVSPFVYDFEMQAALLDGRIGDVKKKIMNAFEALSDKDFVIALGPHDLFEGALMKVDSRTLIHDMDAKVLLVEQWRGPFSMDTLFGALECLEHRLVGSVINKVPDSIMTHVKERVKPFMEKQGINIFGVFHKDMILASMTVRHITEVLNGGVLCCEDRLDEFVESFLIGAMDVDAALSYFMRTPNKAVITGAHRSDIQLAAMETSTKCLILTGGLHPNEMVVAKAREKGVPIIIAQGDTFSIVDQIESSMGRALIREKKKSDRAKELIKAEFDLTNFLGRLSLR